MGAFLSKKKHVQETNEIIKSGIVQIQYGLKSEILDRWITITKTHLNIYASHNTSHLLTSISFNTLLNIDVSHNDNNILYFQALFDDKQHPIINVHCISSSDKHSWVQLFEKYCPNVILTKELQTVKNCARNLSFKGDEIEEALIEYHEKYGSMYSVHEFIDVLLKIREKTEEKKEIEEENKIESISCGVCKQVYSNPVRNIHDKTYCFECITHWFEIIKQDQDCIRDPLTNKKLPLHCRLLIPHFSLMAATWNNNHPKSAEQMHGTAAFRNIDERLDMERQFILKYLLKMDDSKQMSESIAHILTKTETLRFSKDNLNDLLKESMKCYQCFINIRRLIDEGTAVYNKEIKRIFMDNIKQNTCLFEWKEPKWCNFISKTCINWCETYQVHDMLFYNIESETNKMMNSIKSILENQKNNTQQIKEQIIQNILQFQEAQLSEYNAVNDDEKKEYIPPQQQQFKRVDIDKIFYSERNGLVNTKVIEDIAQCVKSKKPFQLYHNDLRGRDAKSMNRDKLTRFLQTAGMDGISTQFRIYQNFASFMKNHLVKLCKYLKKRDADSYWKHLTEIQIIPQKLMDPKDWNEGNDKVVLQITLNLDYDEHLETHNNDKNALCQSIQQQLLRHLGLKCLPGKLTITNVEKGSIRFTACLHVPLISLVCGLLWFGYDVYQCCNVPDFSVSWYRTVTQGAMIGSGIGGILAAKTSLVPAAVRMCGAMIPFGLIGAMIAGAVVVGMIGFVVWKYVLKPDSNSMPMRVPIYQPGGGYYQRYRVSIEDQRHRIAPNQMDDHENISVTLECGHEYIMQYDPDDRNMMTQVLCHHCGTLNDIGNIINMIRNMEIEGNVAHHYVNVLPENFNT